MPSEHALTKERERLSTSPPGSFPIRLKAAIFYIFFSVTALAVFIPLNPVMPSQGIDPSYGFAINQAVARHLSFGRDIVFTYGPYAAFGSRMYDPENYARMMWASVIFGISYILALLYLAHGRNRYTIALFLLVVATFGPGELLLLSYPFLSVLCVFRYLLSETGEDISTPGCRTLLASVFVWATLGILPVVKGNLIMPFAVVVILAPALLVYRSRFAHALLLFCTPIAACIAFWLLAGQSLSNITGFLRGMSWLTVGFTDAMSLPWSALPAEVGNGLVFLYLVISAFAFMSFARSRQLSTALKVILFPLVGVFLFVPFKHGFLGATGVSTAFASLAVFLLIIQLLYTDKYLQWAVYVIIVAAAATSVIHDPELTKQVHDKFGVGSVASGTAKQADILAFCIHQAFPAYGRSTYRRTWSTYSGSWKAIASGVRHDHDLNSRYLEAIQTIKNDYPVPALHGTVDFYEYDQSVLLASGNTWNPRPVIQSYSAYTPELARLDEQHLRSVSAPDWLIFELTPIDGRLPSLDDGMSWPAFLDNYRFVSYNSRFVLMQKSQVMQPASHFLPVSRDTYKTGAKVFLPQSDGFLFAEIDLKPTLAGKALMTLLNPPQLKIVLGLEDGQTKSFRVIANMMKTDFLLSPFVGDTKGFAGLMARASTIQNAGRVRSISIAPLYGGSTYWSSTYELTLKEYVDQQRND